MPVRKGHACKRGMSAKGGGVHLLTNLAKKYSLKNKVSLYYRVPFLKRKFLFLILKKVPCIIYKSAVLCNRNPSF